MAKSKLKIRLKDLKVLWKHIVIGLRATNPDFKRICQFQGLGSGEKIEFITNVWRTINIAQTLCGFERPWRYVEINTPTVDWIICKIGCLSSHNYNQSLCYASQISSSWRDAVLTLAPYVDELHNYGVSEFSALGTWINNEATEIHLKDCLTTAPKRP